MQPSGSRRVARTKETHCGPHRLIRHGQTAFSSPAQVDLDNNLLPCWKFVSGDCEDGQRVWGWSKRKCVGMDHGVSS